MRRERVGPDGIRRWAIFGGAGRYRYALGRVWARKLPTVVFIMLNPSRADEQRDDPTIRRCMNLAAGWGYGSIIVVNLFALRTSRPAVLRRARDPVGPRNDAWVHRAARGRDIVVAWGVHGRWQERWRAVLQRLDNETVLCLGNTKDGHPRHPLYLRRDVRPRVFRAPGSTGAGPVGRPDPDQEGRASREPAVRNVHVLKGRRNTPARRVGRPALPASRG